VSNIIQPFTDSASEIAKLFSYLVGGAGAPSTPPNGNGEGIIGEVVDPNAALIRALEARVETYETMVRELLNQLRNEKIPDGVKRQIGKQILALQKEMVRLKQQIEALQNG
jgi:hypothetical protein